MGSPTDRQGPDAAGPKRRARLSIQSQLILLLVFVLVPTLLIQVGIYYDRLQGRRALALRSNLELARAIGKAFDGLVRDVLNQELAIGIAATSSQPLPARDLNRLLIASRFGYPSVRYFSFISPEGLHVASGEPGAIGKDVSDRSYFQEIVAGKEWVVSDVILSRILGDRVFVICRGIRDDSGVLLGAVLAAVSPESLDKVLSIERKDGGTITLIDKEGAAVFRVPSPESGSMDRGLPKIHPAIKEALAGREASGVFTSSFDGKRKLMAAVPVPGIGWVIAAGSSEDEQMAPAVSSMALQSMLFLAVMLSGFLLALVFSRRIAAPVRKLREYVLLLGNGEAGDEAEIGGASELQDLASAFKKMARKIRSREDSLIEIKNALERRVRERTADLARSNQALKAEIIQRKRAEDTVKFERERLFSLLDNLPAFIYLRSPDHSIRFANRLFRTLYGDTEGKACFEVLNGRDTPCEVCPSGEVLRTKKSKDWEWTHPSSGRIFRIYSHPFTDIDGSPVVLELGTDITECKMAEGSLRESESQLRELSSRLLSVQENERKTIAGEIHDSLGSSLTAIKIALESTRNRLQENGTAEPELLDPAITWTQNALDEARRLMNDLHPPMLEDLGLMHTVNWFLRQYQSIFPQIHVEKEFEIDEAEIPEPLKIVLFRIMQEAFNNISKHSKAEYVTLSLQKRNGLLELTIEDNGEGFDLGSVHFGADHKGGLGLTSMRERARLSGGSLSVASVVGEGTRVCGSWPINV